VPVEDSASILKLAERLAEKGEGIAFLHIQDACKATESREYCDRLLKARIKVYALKADVEARGLTAEMHPSVKIIDYKQWVSLLMNGHNKTVSWTS
jgi:sulfur relay protein TusB/DsrH